jgi:hypothetical protein
MTVFLLLLINITLTFINLSVSQKLERIAEALERMGDKS